jgi:hypothetical protein
VKLPGLGLAIPMCLLPAGVGTGQPIGTVGAWCQFKPTAAALAPLVVLVIYDGGSELQAYGTP